MPSKTAKQARFMAMCAHSPGKAKGKCPPQKVSREFNQADKGGKLLRQPRKSKPGPKELQARAMRARNPYQM